MASEEGKKVPNGYYKVGENIVLITDGEAVVYRGVMNGPRFYKI